MRSCEHARRALSADPAAEPVHAGHHAALREADLLVERARGLVLEVHVELPQLLRLAFSPGRPSLKRAADCPRSVPCCREMLKCTCEYVHDGCL